MYFYLVGIGTEPANRPNASIMKPLRKEKKIKEIKCSIRRNLTCLPARARNLTFIFLLIGYNKNSHTQQQIDGAMEQSKKT